MRVPLLQAKQRTHEVQAMKAGSRSRAYLHLCPAGLSDQSVGACGQRHFFLLGLSAIAFASQWSAKYKVAVTNIDSTQIKTASSSVLLVKAVCCPAWEK